MPRYQSNVPRAINPWWIRGLVALGVLGFFVGVFANAAQAAVLNSDYYQAVLDDEQAYERAYAELATDPELLGISSDLLGGVELPFLDQVPGLLVNAIPVQLVEAMVDDALVDLIAYLKKHKDLELSLDITPFVDGVGSPGLDAAIGGLDELTGGGSTDDLIPEDFEDDIGDILDDFLGDDEGRRLPGFEGLFPAIDGESVLALRTSDTDGDAADVSPAPGIRFAIKDSKYVREEVVDGETRYFLSPPERVVQKVDNALFAVQLVSSNSYWLRPAGIAAFVVALVGLAWLSRRDSSAMMKRLGLTLAIGGLFALLTWAIALPIIQGVVIDAAFEGSTIPSEAFDRLARDVLDRSVSNLTPYIWLPAFVAAGIGLGMLVARRLAMRPNRASA